MRASRIFTPMFALLSARAVAAALFGSDNTTSAEVSSTSRSGNSSAVPPEVALLLTLQEAKISSMSCLIALVNMTSSPIGTCLGLTQLAQLVTNTDATGAPLGQPQVQQAVQGQGQSQATNQSSFADQLATYLDTACANQCSEKDIQEAQAQLGDKCGADSVKDADLIRVLNGVLGGYASSYRTLACMVHYNGTAELCLPSSLNSTTAADSHTFFNHLVSGTGLQQYMDTVWKGAECSGCVYELFKSAQYTTPSIRGSDLTQALGNHLQNDCPGKNALAINWQDVQDQQIPDALQLAQNQNTGKAAGSVAAASRQLGVSILASGLGLVGFAAMLAVGVSF